jgi:hypothetical protein
MGPAETAKVLTVDIAVGAPADHAGRPARPSPFEAIDSAELLHEVNQRLRSALAKE